MKTIARPTGRWTNAANHLLRIYLALFVVGCASTRPKPTVVEARSMETRTLSGDEKTVFKACVGVLQDLGYSVDVANSDVGLITASRQTQERSGEITQETEDPRAADDGMPTWAKVALIATGVILIVFLVAAVSGGSDEKTKDKHDDSSSSTTNVTEAGETSGPTVYHYKVTINMSAAGKKEVRVRASVQGSQMQGTQVQKAGPVNDPSFFQAFFTSLDKSLFLEGQPSKP